MYPEIISFVAGAAGQFVRGLIGLHKAIQAEEKVDMKRFILSLILGCIIGGCAGFMAGNDIRIAALSGYMGTDFIEGLVKR